MSEPSGIRVAAFVSHHYGAAVLEALVESKPSVNVVLVLTDSRPRLMSKVSQLALFFKGSSPDSIYWVRSPIEIVELNQMTVENLVKLVLAQDPALEYLLYGKTEYRIDDEYFASEGASKGLVYVDDCHMKAFVEAFGGATDSVDDAYVRRRCWRIGHIDANVFVHCEPSIVTRVQVSSTKIPNDLSEL